MDIDSPSAIEPTNLVDAIVSDASLENTVGATIAEENKADASMLEDMEMEVDAPIAVDASVAEVSSKLERVIPLDGNEVKENSLITESTKELDVSPATDDNLMAEPPISKPNSPVTTQDSVPQADDIAEDMVSVEESSAIEPVIPQSNPEGNDDKTHDNVPLPSETSKADEPEQEDVKIKTEKVKTELDDGNVLPKSEVPSSSNEVQDTKTKTEVKEEEVDEENDENLEYSSSMLDPTPLKLEEPLEIMDTETSPAESPSKDITDAETQMEVEPTVDVEAETINDDKKKVQENGKPLVVATDAPPDEAVVIADDEDDVIPIMETDPIGDIPDPSASVFDALRSDAAKKATPPTVVSEKPVGDDPKEAETPSIADQSNDADDDDDGNDVMVVTDSDDDSSSREKSKDVTDKAKEPIATDKEPDTVKAIVETGNDDATKQIDSATTTSVPADSGDTAKDASDDDVIMLDDDDDDDVPPVPVTKTAEVDKTAASTEKAPSTDPANPLELMEKLVAKSYAEDEKSASVPSKPASPVPATPDSTTTVPVKAPKRKPSTTAVKASTDFRECVNYECTKHPKEFVRAESFILSHFKVPKKVTSKQFVCVECQEEAICKYEELAGALIAQQPILLEGLPKRADLVEILDSSDEDEDMEPCKQEAEAEIVPAVVRDFFKDNFEDVLAETLKRIDIDTQVSWTKSILEHKITANETMSNEILDEFKEIQKMADQMYAQLYRTSNYVIEEMPPFDLNTNKQMQMAGPTYPPFGDIEYPPIDTSTLYYGVRQKLLAAWIPCKVTEPMEAIHQGVKKQCYKVKFLRMKGVLVKCVPRVHLAYGIPPKVRLHVGVRVIALFQIEPLNSASKENQRASFFPGVVAEPLQAYNLWRYLIFFDDGYAQYVSPDNVRLVCEASKNVWEDVHQDSSKFIENYLLQYKTQRPMVQVKRGQRMVTEWNGKWLYAKVFEIDASLVQMFFEEGKRTEWIYRGSTRLGPLFREKQNVKSAGKRDAPYVEYMSEVVTPGRLQTVSTITPAPIQPAITKPPPAAAPQQVLPNKPPTPPTAQPQTNEEKRANVAKKSVSQPQRAPTVQHMNNSTIYVDEDNRPKGKVVYYTAKKHMPPRKYQTHECSPACLYDVRHNLSSYSPLAKPLLSGWERQICKSKTKKVVMYRAPCGRRLRNMSELHRYLRLTDCKLNVENFDFDYLIHCLAEYVIDSCIVQKVDLSDGKEKMVVPCVNYYDNTFPPECVYSDKRIPTKGVHLNLDPNFLCGCDCEDDCLDKTKCQCWQLTIAGAKFGNPNTAPEDIGYEFKRLPDPVPTGIYECNTRCKCSETCLNRVAQQSLQMKLQVFKTGNRGWGLRCLNDVPKGSFICIYAGDLLTEQHANEAGDNFGDEYFAELDYIEVVENLKEGYEPDVVNDDDFDDDEYDPRRQDDSDDDEFVTSAPVENHSFQTRYNTRTRNSVDASKKSGNKDGASTSNGGGGATNGATVARKEDGGSDEDEERQPISFVPNATVVGFDKENASNKYKSIRKFFGKHEFCYVMDAKKAGNIGRYFNHSCAPNLFVQNVFVDTHDLRFPWVAFFALSHIRAGTELTWNYNYDVGSVPGKVLYCQCGAETCRGRLL